MRASAVRVASQRAAAAAAARPVAAVRVASVASSTVFARASVMRASVAVSGSSSSPAATAAAAAAASAAVASRSTSAAGVRGVQTYSAPADPFSPLDTLTRRHIGPSDAELEEMARACGFDSVDALVDANVPQNIRRAAPLNVGPERGEHEFLASLKTTASKNKHQARSFIGMGYYNTITPPVVLRNLLENPGWYTAYTPYQAELSQGRLESLLNWQTMISDITGMDLANASLLDEATAAAEAMSMCHAAGKKKKKTFLVSGAVFPQTVEVVRARADLIGVNVLAVDNVAEWLADESVDEASRKDVCGVLLQYPAQNGLVEDPSVQIEAAKGAKIPTVVATDLLACTMIKPPGEMGADIVLGNSQRFGVPMGYGGPHAAFFAVADKFKRTMPGRLIGVSVDRRGKRALRMALQTREQHIRRETATSNVCTAQALLANAAAMYGVYHGPDGLRDIAANVHARARVLATGLARVLSPERAEHGTAVRTEGFFDTVEVTGLQDVGAVVRALARRDINVFADADNSRVSIALDETTTADDLMELWEGFAEAHGRSYVDFDPAELHAELAEQATGAAPGVPADLVRTTPFMQHPVFNTHHSETEMLRYMKKLENLDYSLAHGTIPLGSCTMKLNATAEMIPITWPEFANMHPFVPPEQAKGYADLLVELQRTLCDVTGFAGVSLQPNAGSQGELLGLMVIRAYHHSRGDTQRDICILPASAHGTNPASAAMAGMRIAKVKEDSDGNVDLDDLRAVCEKHKDQLACLMITYPSTHGVFEEDIREVIDTVHGAGGQVYMDGANMNSQTGLTSPGDCGADVCHLNLHKTFCIPHGGGGPGMGPIGVARHLVPFLPSHPLVDVQEVLSHGASSSGDAVEGDAVADDGDAEPGAPSADGASSGSAASGEAKSAAVRAVAAAPFSSAMILPISHAYIQMLGSQGLERATRAAIVSANYMMFRLKDHYSMKFTNKNGLCAHEFIIDVAPFKAETGVVVEDVAKRLMDYGFHAPTMAWPVHETLMVEPTESEPKAELDRLCDALISIRKEIDAVRDGTFDKEDNPLKNAPHTADEATAESWDHPYPRQLAVYPTDHVRSNKFWPSVSRIDNVAGDRNLVCSCTFDGETV